jgi:hypothetical protein
MRGGGYADDWSTLGASVRGQSTHLLPWLVSASASAGGRGGQTKAFLAQGPG